MRKLALSIALTALTAAPSFAQAPSRLACAPGYNPDRGGNCQPVNGQENRYCPRGTVFHPQFNGWSCDPPPPEAY